MAVGFHVILSTRSLRSGMSLSSKARAKARATKKPRICAVFYVARCRLIRVSC